MWRYDYDPAGNLAAETDFNGRQLRYGYDAAGHRVERVNGAGGDDAVHPRDALGNLVEKRSGGAVATFAYDSAGRVARAANADAEATYERDALGRVLAEACNGRAVTSAYDQLGQRTRRRTPTRAESLWEYDPAAPPPNSSPQPETSPPGRRRLPSGEPRCRPTQARPTAPLRFPGQYHDSEIGSNYNYHRYRDPTTARYDTAAYVLAHFQRRTCRST